MQNDSIHVVAIGFNCANDCVVCGLLHEQQTNLVSIAEEPTLAKGIHRLQSEHVDVAIVDFNCLGVTNIESIQQLRKKAPDTPILVVLDEEQESLGYEAVRAGAQEFLPREHLTEVLLWRTIHHAIERSKAENQLRTMVHELAASQAMHAEAVHELEITNQELMRSSEEAKQASRAKDEFLAHMSHEIRTPLTAILGYADVLLDQLREPEEIDAAQTIRRNGVHLLDILSDILDLSRIESGLLQLEEIEFSPVDIAEDVLQLMRVRADAKGLDLRCTPAGPIPATMKTDPTRLKQILVNLLGNAIKFTEFGGVLLTTRFDISNADSPRILFEIADTGSGIQQEQLNNIFEPFTQADSSMSRRFGGSGLGLAICKRLGNMLGGTLSVKSTVGEGSTFTLALPIPLDIPTAEPAKKTHLSPLVAPQAERQTQKHPNLACRILLAEDGPDNQRLVSLILRKAGAEVIVAENGRKAVDFALAPEADHSRRYDDPTETFDLILMDMQMPVMDGYEATQKLREAGFTKPILALTAHAMNYDRQKCIDAGCDDYISKPIQRDSFLQTIAQYTKPRRTLKLPEAADTVQDVCSETIS